MSSGLIDIMKRASIDATENSQPCDLRFGTVISTSPLKIKVTNQLVLPASLLVVPQHLTDYNMDVTVSWVTEAKSGGSLDAAYEAHAHEIEGRKSVLIHASLKEGDKVALIRKQGGQTYYILDRIGGE